MYEITDLDDKHVMVEVTHSCGHVQSLTQTKRNHERGEDLFPGYVERQYSWLAENLCPGCFNAGKLINPDLKPVGG